MFSSGYHSIQRQSRKKSRMKYFIPFVSGLRGFHKGGRCRGSIPDVHY